eukprot:1930100-Amphidinium_carterae.1
MELLEVLSSVGCGTNCYMHGLAWIWAHAGHMPQGWTWAAKRSISPAQTAGEQRIEPLMLLVLFCWGLLYAEAKSLRGRGSDIIGTNSVSILLVFNLRDVPIATWPKAMTTPTLPHLLDALARCDCYLHRPRRERGCSRGHIAQRLEVYPTPKSSQGIERGGVSRKGYPRMINKAGKCQKKQRWKTTVTKTPPDHGQFGLPSRLISTLVVQKDVELSSFKLCSVVNVLEPQKGRRTPHVHHSCAPKALGH